MNIKDVKIKMLVDSREKSNEKITDAWDKNGVEYYIPPKGLRTGDYSIAIQTPSGEVIDFRDKVVIERKNSLEELSTNVTKNRDRFIRELERAKENNTKFILLIEDDKWYENLVLGRYNTFTHNHSFLASLMAFKSRYNIEIVGVDKKFVGSYIYKTLYYEVREYLKNMEV